MDGVKGAGIGWGFEVGDVRGPVFWGAAGAAAFSCHRCKWYQNMVDDGGLEWEVVVRGKEWR